MYREFNALGTLEILKFLPSTRANCFHLRLRGVWHRQILTCCPTKDLCASEVIITTPFISLQIRSELFSLIECEQVVLPINPARVGCQLVFALRLGTTIALGGADHRVWQRRIPETAHDESGIPLTLFTRQVSRHYKDETCPHMHANDRLRRFRVSATKTMIRVWVVVVIACSWDFSKVG